MQRDLVTELSHVVAACGRLAPQAHNSVAQFCRLRPAANPPHRGGRPAPSACSPNIGLGRHTPPPSLSPVREPQTPSQPMATNIRTTNPVVAALEQRELPISRGTTNDGDLPARRTPMKEAVPQRRRHRHVQSDFQVRYGPTTPSHFSQGNVGIPHASGGRIRQHGFVSRKQGGGIGPLS